MANVLVNAFDLRRVKLPVLPVRNDLIANAKNGTAFFRLVFCYGLKDRVSGIPFKDFEQAYGLLDSALNMALQLEIAARKGI